MKIQYASDLHIEFYDNSVFLARNPFKVAGDVLVLAGDIFPLKEWKDYRQHRFFDWCRDNFRETILIPGNHEFYGSDIADWDGEWELELRPNVRMHQNRVLRIDDVDFILTTLWSRIPERLGGYFRKNMSDFTLIRKGKGPFTVHCYNEEHEKCLAFLKEAVASSKAPKKVVVTHHVPTSLCVAPEHKGSTLNPGFTVDLSEYIQSSDIDLWIYGHSHRSIDASIEKTRIVSNQVGYVAYSECVGSFSGDRYVNLDDELPAPRSNSSSINLSNQWNGGIFFEKVDGEDGLYELTGERMGLRVLYGDNGEVDAVDPFGGPFIDIGYKVVTPDGNKYVESIRLDGERILISLFPSKTHD